MLVKQLVNLGPREDTGHSRMLIPQNLGFTRRHEARGWSLAYGGQWYNVVASAHQANSKKFAEPNMTWAAKASLLRAVPIGLSLCQPASAGCEASPDWRGDGSARSL
jgi:hypothetical protein